MQTACASLDFCSRALPWPAINRATKCTQGLESRTSITYDHVGVFRGKGTSWGSGSDNAMAHRRCLVRAGQGGGGGGGSRRSDRSNKKGTRRRPPENPQMRNPIQPPSEFPGTSSSGVTTELDETTFNERLKAIKTAGAERPKPDEIKLGPIDYEAPPEKKDDQPIKPWVKAVSIAGALIFLVSFALSDLVLQNLGVRPKQDSAEIQELSPEEKERLQRQAEAFEATLSVQPEDAVALEGAGVSYAEMGEFKKATEYLDKLVKARPSDAEALRLLAEIKYAAQDYSGAVYEYRRAIRVNPRESLGLLKGLADALVSDKRPKEAVGEILKARDRIAQTGDSAAAPTSESVAAKSGDSEAAPTSESVAAKSDAEERIDPVQVELLLAKAYQAWNKPADALSVYDGIITGHPDDFRPYLAKGLLLKLQKQEGEADRNFIKARFLAPEAGKRLIDRVTGR